MVDETKPSLRYESQPDGGQNLIHHAVEHGASTQQDCCPPPLPAVYDCAIRSCLVESWLLSPFFHRFDWMSGSCVLIIRRVQQRRVINKDIISTGSCHRSFSSRNKLQEGQSHSANPYYHVDILYHAYVISVQ